MSTKLGTLTLDLIAKIGNFTGPIKDAEKQTKTSFDNMRKHVNTYGMAIAGATAGAVTALATMAVDTANQAAELERFALRANTTTQEFQKMAVGASAFGIEGDKLSDMMKDFNEKLGELTAIGAGGGVDFFEQIAMKTEGSSEAAKKLILDMQKLSGPEALQLYVDKLEEAGVTQQQMSFYLESMASDLTDLYPLLANGGEGMKLYGDMAERAGIIMTDKTKEAALLLKDQMFMLDLQFQGVKNQLMTAVIPAFVDIAEAFFGGAEQGLQFTDVAEGVAKTLKGMASVAIGAVTAIQLVGKALGGMAAIGGAVWNELDWYEMNPLGLAKAAYEARGEIAALTSEIKTDMHETVMGAANRLDRMWEGGSSEQAKQLPGIRELKQCIGDTNDGMSELADKQNEAAKKTKENNKAQQELNRLLEERNRILYEYSSTPDQMKMDLDGEIKRLKATGLSDYIPIAKARYEEERKLAEMQFGWEVSEHRYTEMRKLELSYGIKRQEILADTKFTEMQQAAKLQALGEMFKQEVTMLHISEQKQLLEAKRHWMAAGEYAQDYYALVREEILGTASYSPQMKEALLQQAASSQNIEESYERDSAIADYRDVMGYGENPLERQFEVLQKMRELDLLNEEAYQNAKLELQAKSTASYMEGMLGGFASLVDENSKTYAVLFGAQKAFAVAQAMLNIPAAYSKAYDAVVGTPFVGPYIAPAVGAAAAALQVAQAASMKSVNLTGMAHDGIDNIPQEGTWLLDGGERVLNPEQNKDLTRYLSEARESNPSPNVNLNPNFVIVDEREKLGDYLFGPDGKKAFVKFFKQNKRELGFA